MATSGTATFSRNRDQIIKRALRLAGAIEAGETPGAQEVTDASESLNAMVKHWQGSGNFIWTMAQATLFLQASQTSYTLSSTSTDHCTEAFVQTALSAAAISGATFITVSSITGITTGDYVGVQINDGSFHWTTVNGAPSGVTVALTAGLADSAASGALVVTYTTKIVRPLRITSARRYNFTSAIDTPLEVDDREGYFDLPNKTSSGTPNMVFYDRRGGANAAGKLYLWQPQTSPTDAIKFTWARPIQDFSVAADDPDLPQEWIKTLQYNLALDLAVEYGTPLSQYAILEKTATRCLAEVTWNERELGSIQFSPGR